MLGRITYHLELVLPELLLLGLVEEWEFADMVDEDVPKDWKLRIKGGYLAEVRFERGTKSSEGSWGVQL
jgi:hypothetical protein